VESPSDTDPRVRHDLSVVYAATFFIRFGFGLTLSTFAFYLENTVAVVGLAASAAPLVEFLTVVLLGIVADRYGRVKVLRGGLGLGTVLLLLMSSTRNPAWEALYSGFFGLASGGILAASLAIVGDRSRPNLRGREMGYFDATNLLGWAGGFGAGYGMVSLVGGIAHPDRLVASFWLGAACCLVALGALQLYNPASLDQGNPLAAHWQNIRRAILDGWVLLLVLPWAVIYMLVGTLFVFLGTAAQTYSLAPWELGVAVAGGGSLLLLTQPLYGRLSDRYGRERLMTVGIAGFLGILLSASALVLEGLQPWTLGALVLSALAALAFGPSSLAALTDISRSFTRATTMSMYSLMIALGMAVGLVLSSGLYTWLGSRGVVIFFGILAVLLVLLTALRMYRGAAFAPPGQESPPNVASLPATEPPEVSRAR
jgi:DHA1 family multidrug resistance protein-like MFS transporter